MSASWRIGKIEQVKIGDDGYVRQALIAYKDTSGDEPADWTHRTVERPARKIVKLFHINDTTLMDDIKAVHENAKKLLLQEEISFVAFCFATLSLCVIRNCWFMKIMDFPSYITDYTNGFLSV